MSATTIRLGTSIAGQLPRGGIYSFDFGDVVEGWPAEEDRGLAKVLSQDEVEALRTLGTPIKSHPFAARKAPSSRKP